MISYEQKIFIIGNGGHAKVLAGLLRRQYPLGSVSYIIQSHENISSDTIFEFDFFENRKKTDKVYNGVGPKPYGNTHVMKITEKYKQNSCMFPNLISNESIIATKIIEDSGIQILCGSIVSEDVKIGRYSVLNHGVIVEHDCEIGDFCHLAPGAIICGGVNIADGCFIGAGAVILPGVIIGKNATISANSKVHINVPPGEVYFGN